MQLTKITEDPCLELSKGAEVLHLSWEGGNLNYSNWRVETRNGSGFPRVFHLG